MSDTPQFDTDEQTRAEDERADALAALAVVVVVVLAGIHFVYTGGLPAFFASIL